MIERHIKNFSTLHSDASRSRWTAATKYRAPHKPLLLLAVIVLIAQGIIKTNFKGCFNQRMNRIHTDKIERIMSSDLNLFWMNLI